MEQEEAPPVSIPESKEQESITIQPPVRQRSPSFFESLFEDKPKDPNEPGIVDEIFKTVSEAIDAITAPNNNNNEGEPEEGFIDGIIRTVTEAVDGITKEDPEDGAPKEEGFIDGIIKSVSETIDSVTAPDNPEEKENAKESSFGDYVKSIFGGKPSLPSLPPVEIAVIGSANVGKTTMVHLYVSGKTPASYDEDYHRKVITSPMGRRPYVILDTGGAESLNASVPNWIANKSGILLVFSVADANSFEYIKTFHDKIDRISTPVLILGTHIDDASPREVSTEDAQSLAGKWHSAYMELDGRDKDKVVAAFQQLFDLCTPASSL